MDTAVVMALASVLCWSWAATAFKKALQTQSPWFVVFAGSVVSTVVLFIALLARGRRVRRGQLLRSALYGAMNPFLYYMVLLNAYDGLPAQVAMVVNYLWPVMLVLLSVPFLGQRITLRGMGAVLLSFSGVALMALGGSDSLEIPIGPLLLAFLSTVIWAVYWLLNTRSKGDTGEVLFANFLFGTVWLLLYGLLSGEDISLNHAAIPWLLYIGVFEMGITYMLWNTALKKARNTASVGSLIFLTPFLALIPIALVVGEGIAPSTIAGLVLVTGGIIAERRSRLRESAE